ncbi:peptidoglycan-associated lipoprotein Pal [Mangrovicoccus algicola]|uniref:Peptidoglycan-associated lipoprotein n=1 Tax=Mangrovicoccus algicola TaxID=2771008 RepID=A0A8J6YY92_9RHOB|nr:peptidoglycan-associated lipoprotein Pal [Mangrovicoccus algicola]MBE3639997.1 peptidoglycan-associated lipoprotein Pal [Mangrovicoccus algicola]
MNRIASLGLVAALALTAACSNRADNLSGSSDLAGDRYGYGSGTGAGGIANPASAAYFQAQVGDRVLFPVDQSSLTAEARGILDGQARWLSSNPSFSAVIEGHADEQGTREYNLALGARRASAVYDYLVSRGIPSSRLRTVSYGKERPIEVCSEESCYAKNRRAVTSVSSGAGV